MAKSTERNDAPDGVAPNADYLSLFQPNDATMDAMVKASDAMLKGVAALGQEMVDFANTRVKQNLETSQSLMGCNDLSQAFGLQCDFARTATQHYLQEANKLMNLTASMTRQSWAPLEERTKETLSRLNGR
ncbi:phasin family protein [Rhodospirillaceae bacterium SYSU D60014]|uniref:phasin family protein n=1 Tax=Virgifigura deserti TaxID=2268457 RepID=UPI0013C4E1AD